MATIWDKLDAVHKFAFLAEQWPRFVAAFGPLSEACKQTFSCGIDKQAAKPADIAVYGLGRLCLEDFAEILFLAEHDYGYAAIKLLRGLYERAVVNEIIVEDPKEEGARFFNYYTVDERKFNRRGMESFAGWADDPSNMKASFEEYKGDYKYEPCSVCGLAPQRSWTKYGLDALAGKLGATTNDRNLRELGKELKGLYLACASVPNLHIHASMASILQRLEEKSAAYVFMDGSQKDQVEYALSQAHGLMILALNTQNQYFNLGLEVTLERLREDRTLAWPVDHSRPPEGGTV